MTSGLNVTNYHFSLQWHNTNLKGGEGKVLNEKAALTH
jgi:hypothetical protein